MSYENSYRGEIKSLAGECYEWGLVDAYTRVWEKLQVLRRKALDRQDHVTSGFMYVVEQMEKLVNAGFETRRTTEEKQVARRMKNADIAIDNLIDGAVKTGALRPQIKRVS